MKICNGDVFDSFLTQNSCVVHGCNSLGVMGSGIAKTVRNNFPAAYYEYVCKHDESGLALGEIIPVMVLPGRYIINAITQQYCGNDGRRYVCYDAIRECFKRVAVFAKENNIESINYPLIGAALGGGDWNIISAIIDEELGDLNHTLWKL